VKRQSQQQACWKPQQANQLPDQSLSPWWVAPLDLPHHLQVADQEAGLHSWWQRMTAVRRQYPRKNRNKHFCAWLLSGCFCAQFCLQAQRGARNTARMRCACVCLYFLATSTRPISRHAIPLPPAQGHRGGVMQGVKIAIGLPQHQSRSSCRKRLLWQFRAGPQDQGIVAKTNKARSPAWRRPSVTGRIAPVVTVMHLGVSLQPKSAVY